MATEPPLDSYAPPEGESTASGTLPTPVRRTSGVRTPPHNREAEESVLGAIFLSNDAANLVLDKLDAEDFYVPAYQAIYEAIQDLYNGNQPIDAVTVTDLLGRKGELERIGGVGFITRLMSAVPVASRVEYYAEIVEEHSLRRRLMAAGARVTEYAMETEEEIEAVIDAAEQTVFGVAERRVGKGLEVIGTHIQSTIELIEELGANTSEITGLPTGYRDLDKKLAGLHPANLVVIAARPAMGKSALGLNIASNVALHGGVVAVFSMEMGREEIIQRLLCSIGRVDSMKLRSGQLDPRQWQGVVNAAGKLFEAPIYIDDAPHVTVTDIRAKSRRLKRQRGLDLILVDYLQLMQGRNRENRQQEIAEISRNLKNLARELHVPILAISQLNRSLEAREDKRPRLGDLRECLTGESVIRRADGGGFVTIAELARSGAGPVPVWSVDRSLRLVPAVMTEAWSTGVKPVYLVRTDSGRSVRATANHPLLTDGGWMPVGALRAGDRIAVAGAPTRHRLPAARVPAASGATSHPAAGPGEAGLMTARPATVPSVRWDAVVTIEADGDEETFDARVPGTHNFLAGDVVVHNSGAIEQDSDIVMFIYRHEYYHAEDLDSKGLAEVIVAKHRSGSTGKVDMTFLPEFTLFADLGRDVSA